MPLYHLLLNSAQYMGIFTLQLTQPLLFYFRYLIYQPNLKTKYVILMKNHGEKYFVTCENSKTQRQV